MEYGKLYGTLYVGKFLNIDKSDGKQSHLAPFRMTVLS